jgi:hypothetical protein
LGNDFPAQPLLKLLSCDAYKIQMLPGVGINCLDITNPWSVELVLHDIGFKR